MDRLSTKGQMIDQVDLRTVPHSGFDRSNHNYGSGRLGSVQPMRLDEVYPGDRIKGRPQIVANFEPLAAPLMGSMVLKQESFFIPYYQLWRHTYKFFTGKNGFNELMPSVTPLRIFQVFNNQIHHVWSHFVATPANNKTLDYSIKVLSQVYNQTNTNNTYSFFSSGKSLYVDLKVFVDTYLATLHLIFDSRKMFDLVEPSYNIFKRFLESEYLQQTSTTLDLAATTLAVRKSTIDDFCSVFGNVLKEVFDFFHGPSSLFDYLGWPVPIDMTWPKTGDVAWPARDKGWINVFQFNLAAHVQNYSITDSLDTLLSTYFSQVPLTFMSFKAYYLVWYWNYRDQLLETGILDPEEDEFLGSTITDNEILYCCIMRQRCWYKDTFTTALTNTGDGNLQVPVNQSSDTVEWTYYTNEGNLVNTTDAAAAMAAGASIAKVHLSGITYKIPMNYLRGSQVGPYAATNQDSGLGISLDLFDRVRRLRAVTQKRLILGYEVDDVVYSSFFVRMSNVRIHIPELLGRGRDAVQINTLVNNTSTSEQIAGDKTATAFAHGQMSEMNYFSEDWGLYLHLATIMPIQSYAGGMQRLYLKRDPLDYMWPEYAQLGMDAVYNCELAALGTKLDDAQGLAVFGYQGRYYDLKSRLDEEHGRLLTDLNYLTFSREWDRNNPPKLNYIFVHCWPRLDGFVLASPNTDVFRYDCYNAVAWERRLPVPSEVVGRG